MSYKNSGRQPADVAVRVELSLPKNARTLIKAAMTAIIAYSIGTHTTPNINASGTKGARTVKCNATPDFSVNLVGKSKLEVTRSQVIYIYFLGDTVSVGAKTMR
ncbi:hypothetical protein Q5424_08355 [Conexibacter sp. JD483]|uniref:hypothetical protein n=1 Tax=unclassified Conexibacter TaxID=2627773 RepID=UPI00271B022A|nr:MULTISPECIES: hypothetical protein [unclassified Conexibacter]MDO8183950.1 hypothetical protein [Conexibacter sp. CPCC 205706]MDO8196942.1 hypothetical protein [Conexibacter sp. CPCC 205762]MDR9369088.1 hypothetical protein [Conexibacter sp. JD483]